MRLRRSGLRLTLCVKHARFVGAAFTFRLAWVSKASRPRARARLRARTSPCRPTTGGAACGGHGKAPCRAAECASGVCLLQDDKTGKGVKGVNKNVNKL